MPSRTADCKGKHFNQMLKSTTRSILIAAIPAYLVLNHAINLLGMFWDKYIVASSLLLEIEVSWSCLFTLFIFIEVLWVQHRRSCSTLHPLTHPAFPNVFLFVKGTTLSRWHAIYPHDFSGCWQAIHSIMARKILHGKYVAQFTIGNHSSCNYGNKL